MTGLLWGMALILLLSLPAACVTRSALAPAQKSGIPPPPAPTSTPKAEVPGGLTPSAAKVKIVFHPIFRQLYSTDPAAAPGRMLAILNELQGVYDFVQPEPAREEDLRRVHTQRLVDCTKWSPERELGQDLLRFYSGELYDIAALAAGGAILAAELAAAGEVAFALVRPPGHHASADHSSGYCYLNNIAIAVARLLDEKKTESVLIVDFDLHPGNGTADIFRDDRRVTYYWLPVEGDRTQQLESLEDYLKEKTDFDILAVSAGFDRAKEGWGGMLEIGDYRTIGKLLKEAAKRNCQGRRFGVLEGGYAQRVLGKNVKAFLEGFE